MRALILMAALTATLFTLAASAQNRQCSTSCNGNYGARVCTTRCN